MGRPRIHVIGTSATQRVALSTRALIESGGARKTFRFSDAANTALKTLMRQTNSKQTETALIEKLLIDASKTNLTKRVVKMQLDSQISNIIKNSIVETLHPEKIIIFGSYARGEATEDSDIDIAVIVKDDQPTDINAIAKARFNLRKSLGDSILAFDFILQTKNKFDDKKNVKGTVQYEINNQGIAIYG